MMGLLTISLGLLDLLASFNKNFQTQNITKQFMEISPQSHIFLAEKKNIKKIA